MNEKETRELLVEYEDLILAFSRKMYWLLKQERSKRYQFAVHGDMHDRTIKKLEEIHQKLFLYAGLPW